MIIREDDLPCEKFDNGLWVVRNCGEALEWNAWCDWLATEFRRKFLPDVMTVWMAFPPTSQSGADFVAQQIRDIRKEIGRCKPVPLHPKPWRGPHK